MINVYDQVVFMNYFILLSFIAGVLLLGTDRVNAAPATSKVRQSAQREVCLELKEELFEMQKAQVAVMNSLVNNHQTFAVTLEEYSETLPSAPKLTSKEMKRSAQSFRLRGVQGLKMATKLNQASSELIARVANCLR